MDSPHPRAGGPQRRRRFSSADKLAHLAAYEQACATNDGGAYLRREGLYSSSLSEWRKQRDAGVLTGKPAGKVGAHERLSGAWNFRDVAETASLRPGRLFRSSELSSLDDAGRATLTELGVTDVADLRSPGEVARRGGGAVPNDVAVHNLPFPEVTQTHGDDGHAEAPHESSFQKLMTEFSEEDPTVATRRWMTGEYERFPTLGGARAAVRRIITMLADGHPVLVHCFAGKDRTGFAVAVALEAAGVAPEQIMADYLRSNDAVGRLRDSILAAMRSREGITDEVVSFAESRLTDEVLGVRAEYLSAARRVLDTHGGLPGFLAAAQVTEDDVARLRAQLLG